MAQVFENIGAGEGNRTLVISWKASVALLAGRGTDTNRAARGLETLAFYHQVISLLAQ
jgi:hypothetical protein